MEMITSYDYSSIKNEELRKITNIIRNSCTAITGYTFKIAALVVKVEENDLYIEDGFSDIVDYVKRCFGFEKSTTYNMLKIGRFFIDYYQERDVYETALKHEAGNDFSISQVIKMLPLGIEKAKELTHDDVITPDMSCRQIERIVKANLNRMVDPDEDDEDEDITPEPVTDHSEPSSRYIYEDDNVLYIDFEALPDEIREYFINNYDLDTIDIFYARIPH